MEKKPALGVSACLLGQAVRFDGGHKRQSFISETLARYFELQPVCPEVELGLGVPRPTIQLRRDPISGAVRLINPRQGGGDLTDSMQDYAASRVAELGQLAGCILKKGSPSCGMERVPVVINDSGHRLKEGVGLFAQTFMARWPLVPAEEEGRLNDPAIRENFIERVCALQRWRDIEEPGRNVGGFIDFHTRHKLLLMARGTTYYRELGQLVAGTTRASLVRNRGLYIERFMQVMALHPTPAQQVNVLQHLLGFLKGKLESADKQELLALFERYRRNEVPLITPLTLLSHHLRRLPDAYLAHQHYLAPYPESLALRSYTR